MQVLEAPLPSRKLMKKTRLLLALAASGCGLVALSSLAGCTSLGARAQKPTVVPGPRPSAVRPQLVPQVAHSGQVEAIVFSPDGRLCATATGDYQSPTEIKLWDARTWQVLRVLRGPRDSATMLAFAPDGATLAAASEDSWENETHPVWLWSVASGAVLSRLPAQGRVHGLAFSNDGATLLTASSFGLVKWNARTGAELQKLVQPPKMPPVESFAASPDGSLIATGGYGTVDLWDTASAAPQQTVKGQSQQVKALAWSPDGGTLLSAGDGGAIRMVDADAGSVLKTIKTGSTSVSALAFAPDGLSFASASPTGGVRVWSTEGKLLRAIPVQRYAGRVVAWSPDGKDLVGDSDSGALSVWDARSGKVRRRLVGNVALDRFTSSPDGSRWATSAGGTVHLWDARAARVQRVVTHDAAEGCCCGAAPAFTPDGRTLATGADEVRLWDAESGRLQRKISGFGDGIDAIYFLRGSSRLLTTGSTEGYRKNSTNYYFGTHAYLWDARWKTAPRRTFKIVRPSEEHGSTSLSPDGRNFAVVEAKGQTQLWDAQSGKRGATLQPPATKATSASGGSGAASISSRDIHLSFSERGALASSTGQGRISLWQQPVRPLSRPQRVLQLKIGAKPWRDVVRLDFGPQERTLVTTGHDAILRFWDIKTGQQVRSLSAREVGVFGWSGFSPDGRQILTHGTTGNFEIRDARTGSLLVTLMILPPQRPGLAASEWLAFTPAGHYDSSPGARRFIAWLSGDRLYPAAKFEKQFHRPDLVRRTLQGQPEPAA